MYKFGFIALIFIALLLRGSLIFKAYHGDMNNNISWGTLAAVRGLNNFYGSPKSEDWPYSAPNQPPLTIITFALLRKAWVFLENTFWYLNNNYQIFPSKLIWFWEGKGMMFLIKLPSLIADLVIGFLLYKYSLDKFKNIKKSLVVASIWLFNPLTWYNSSIWGQTDSVVNLLGFVSILFLLRKNLVWSLVFLTLSFLFKGSLGLFIPILLFFALLQRYSIKIWIKSALLCILLTVVVSVWFHPNLDLPFWLIDLYRNRILPGEIGYLTAGAYNFWWLIGGGEKIADSTVFFGFTSRLIGFVIALGGLLTVFLKLKNDYNSFEKTTGGKPVDESNLICHPLEIKGNPDRKVVGGCHKLKDDGLLLSLCLISLVSFLFMTRIHGRYLYPFFIPATILLAKYKFIIPIYLILSVTYLINMYFGFWYPPMAFLESALKGNLLPNIISLTNVIIFLLFLRQYSKAKI